MAWECAVFRGDCGLVVDAVKGLYVAVEGEARGEVIDDSCDAEAIDFGLASLVIVDAGRVVFEGSASSVGASLGGALRVARLLARSRPNIPEFGLLLVPGAILLVGAVVFPALAVPARVLVAIDEAPGCGSRLRDSSEAGTEAEETEAEETAPLFLPSMPLSALPFFASSFFCALPRPAVGCRRERARFSPVAEEEEDMVGA